MTVGEGWAVMVVGVAAVDLERTMDGAAVVVDTAAGTRTTNGPPTWGYSNGTTKAKTLTQPREMILRGCLTKRQ